MEKFQELANEWISLQGKVRKECIKFLKKTLKGNDNHLDWDDDDLDASISVGYNGGNHPEYASNMYSTVSGIDLDENGDITLDIEDDPRYYIDDVSTEDLYYVCDFVDNILLPKE